MEKYLNRNRNSLDHEIMHEKRLVLTIAGKCPLDCEYCWLPKTEVTEDIHEKIREKIKDNSFLDEIEAVMGKELEALKPWGFEPAVSLELLEKKIPVLKERFPKLKKIELVTAMLHPDRIISFIKELSRYGIGIRLVPSWDGPSFVVDKNRFDGAGKTLRENFFKIVSELQDVETEVNFQIGATLRNENIYQMAKDKKKAKEFADFFEKLKTDFEAENYNQNLEFSEPIIYYIFPGKFSSGDGKKLAQFFKNIHEFNLNTQLEKMLASGYKLSSTGWFDDKRSTSCGAGDNVYGLDLASDGSGASVCDRPLYFKNEKYVESILKKNEEEEAGQIYTKEKINSAADAYYFNPHDTEDEARLNYIVDSYKDFSTLQFKYIKTIITELALAGQIKSYFLENEKLRNFFTIFAFLNTGCFVEWRFNSGSQYLSPISRIRWLGNGAFKELVNWGGFK